MEDKIVVIHQPDFFPYLGFFHRIMLSDVYVVLDNVQFIRGGSNCWTNRDQIKTAGGAKWITVPYVKAPLGTNINEIRINNTIDWKSRILNEIRSNYFAANGFEEVFPCLVKMLDKDYEYMSDLTYDSIKMIMDMLSIEIQVEFSSELKPNGTSNERVIDIVKKVGAHRYLSGVGAKNYFDEQLYLDAGIEVIWQNFNHPVYKQQFQGFLPNLSSLDLLLNCGIEKSREIMRSTVQ